MRSGRAYGHESGLRRACAAFAVNPSKLTDSAAKLTFSLLMRSSPSFYSLVCAMQADCYEHSRAGRRGIWSVSPRMQAS